MSLLPNEKRYTYADYCTWDDSERVELIDGVLYAMSSPSTEHAAISRELFGQLFNFLKDKSCQLFSAPFDVRLNIDNDYTVVQPDILVICDKRKINERGCKGAPDLVIEILSPSTASYDCIVKYEAYRRAGVQEYWIIDPITKTAHVCLLKNGNYEVSSHGKNQIIEVSALKGCCIDLSAVFND
jgi:Uma2 family endonuclease